MKYCSHCGEKIEDNIKFCPKCGAEVQTSALQNNKEKKNLNIMIIAGAVVLAVIVIIAVVCIVFLNGNKGSDSAAQTTTQVTTEQQTTEVPTTEQPTTEEATTEESQKDTKAKKKKKSAPVEYQLMEGDYTKGAITFSIVLQDGESYCISGTDATGVAFLSYAGKGVYTGSWTYGDTNDHLTDVTLKTTKTGFTLSTSDTLGMAWSIDETWPGKYEYQNGAMQKKSSSKKSSSSSVSAGYYRVKVKEGTYLALRSTPETRDDNIDEKLYNGQTVQVDSVTGNFAYVYSEDLEQWGYVNADYLVAE